MYQRNLIVVNQHEEEEQEGQENKFIIIFFYKYIRFELYSNLQNIYLRFILNIYI